MKIWKILSNVKKVKDKDQIIKKLLENRGISKKEEKEFFNPDLSSITSIKLRINNKELKKAVTRINSAFKKNEKIIIFGDYDVDGICGTAILWETLYKKYKNVFPYIPHRKEEGYGLTNEGIKNILSLYPDSKIIITVDNGIVASGAVDFAKTKNIGVIITDHHEKGKKIPNAFAIIHATKTCGAGIAWALAQEFKVDKNEHLELVALATVADMVPLVGPNRTLLKFGLEMLKKTTRSGLLELLNESAINKEKIGVYEIGHIIAPRLNATGRVSHAMDSLRLLCTKDNKKAKEYAQNLGKTNKERQLMTEETTNHARSITLNSKSAKIIFVSHQEYNQGVIGLVASRLVEEFYRPSFVISVGEKYSKGSARSIKGVNIIQMIRSLSDFIVEAGGHPMAAGFTLETEKIEEFRKELEKRANETITQDLLKKTLIIDLPLEFKHINFDLYKKIESFSPFGIGNPEPTFMTKNVIVEDLRLVGMDGKHAKLNLKSQSAAGGSNLKFDGIAFGMGEFARKNLHSGETIDIVYTIEEDNWLARQNFSEGGNVNKKLQLKIKDLKKL